MYLESVKFKRKENSKWESGYYIGLTDNAEESTLLDASYKPVDGEIYDMRTDTSNWVQFRCTTLEDIRLQEKLYGSNEVKELNSF